MKHSKRTLGLAFALVFVVGMIASGCGASAQPAPAAVQPAVREAAALSLPVTIDAKTADEIRARDDVVILDVREDDEFKSGHIPGAMWIPLGQLASRMNELPKDKIIVDVCRSGNRSAQATELLRQNGFNAHNMQGGMNAWVQAGLEVEK